MTYQEKLAELAATQPQRDIDYVMDMGRRLEIFKRHMETGNVEMISDKVFRIPFYKS